MDEIRMWAEIGQSMALGGAVGAAFALGVFLTLGVFAAVKAWGQPSEQSRSRQAAMWACEQFEKRNTGA